MSAGLFHRALMQSGSCQVPTAMERETQHVAFAEQLGCDRNADAACFRGLDPVAVTEAQPNLDLALADPDSVLLWGPTIDGHILVEPPHASFQAGRQHDVPFAIGSNADEMTFFLLLTNVTQQQYLDFIDATFGPQNQMAILAYYDRMGLEAWRRPAIDLTTDIFFTCEARRVARMASMTQTAPVYRYYFTWFIDNALGRPAGAAHGIELPMLFQRTSIGTYDFTTEELAMGDAMQRYWARFAIAGDPNDGNDPLWPAHDPATDAVLRIDTPPMSQLGVDTEECDLIDSLLGF